MNEVLKHSEAHITKTANEAAHVRFAASATYMRDMKCIICTPVSSTEANHAVPSGDPYSRGGGPSP